MRRALLAAALLTLVVPIVRADVAPIPAWRVMANGRITGAVDGGGTVYLAGRFTKVGRGVTPFEAFVDSNSLAAANDPGCATHDGQVLGTEADGGARLVVTQDLAYPDRLRDANGQYPLASDVRIVRVGADCRWDRRFAIRFPFSVSVDGRAVTVGSALYVGVRTIGPLFSFGAYVGVFAATTGSLIGGWAMPARTQVLGVTPSGQLAIATDVGPDAVGLSHLDPSSGSVRAVRSVSGSSWRGEVVGGRLLTSSTSFAAVRTGVVQVVLRDLTTFEALPGWPDVQAPLAGAWVATALGGRLYLALPQATAAGDTARSLRVFDLESGALVPGWTAPTWIDDAGTTIKALGPLAGRLAVYGDFASGPRDTLALLDPVDGALEEWAPGYAATAFMRAGPVTYLGRVTTAPREHRRGLAAIDPASGAVLPWDPAGPLATADSSAAIAYAGGHVYVGGAGGLRRYDAVSGAPDSTWRVEVTSSNTLGSSAYVDRLSMGVDALYATGLFDKARGSGAVFEERATGVAVRLTGELTPWRPAAGGTCSGYGGRIPWVAPCTSGVVLSGNVVFMTGTFATGAVFAAVRADTGALDLTLSTGPYSVTGMGGGPGAAFLSLVRFSSDPFERRFARHDPGVGLTLLPIAGNGAQHMAARGGRFYAQVERDDVSGAATGNPAEWAKPVPSADGMLDIEYGSSEGDSIDYHPDVAAAAPGTPEAFTATVNGTRVSFDWRRASTDLQLLGGPGALAPAATFYVILASLAPGAPTIAALDTGSTDTAFDVTAPIGTFFVRVQARNQFGTSAPSNEVRVDVRPSAPNAPTGTVAVVNRRTVRIAWQAPFEGWPATAFVLEAGTAPGAGDIGAVPVRGTELVVPGVPPGRYYVRVRAVNAQGASAPGDEVVIDVP